MLNPDDSLLSASAHARDLAAFLRAKEYQLEVLHGMESLDEEDMHTIREAQINLERLADILNRID